VGEAGTKVDPYNIDSMAAGMEKVLLASKAKYNSLIEKGLEQAKEFSWERTARETLRVITNI